MSVNQAEDHLQGRPAEVLYQDLFPSLGLIFELVLPESPSKGGRPNMKSRPSRQRKKQKEGDLEPDAVHHTSGHSAECQLPQHFQRGQKTVVGCLKDKDGKDEWNEENCKRKKHCCHGHQTLLCIKSVWFGQTLL